FFSPSGPRRDAHSFPTRRSSDLHADVWTAGVAYGGLMHDTGKLLCDIRVETKNGQPWHPWHGPLTEAYRFKYIPGRDYKLHNARSEEHTSELQSRENVVCRLLLE